MFLFFSHQLSEDSIIDNGLSYGRKASIQDKGSFAHAFMSVNNLASDIIGSETSKLKIADKYRCTF